MERNNKEFAFDEYIKMIEKSWTWARLTDSERESCLDSFNFVKSQNILKGTFNQRWMILHGIYHAFLNGVGYPSVSGWYDWRKECAE